MEALLSGYVLMRFDISAQRVAQHGPGYRPHDGDHARVHPDAVQKYRDRGWQIVRAAPPAGYDPTCILCETGEEPGHEH